MKSHPVSDDVQRAFFERSVELYEGAAKGSEIRHTFRIAETTVRLRFAGDALVDEIIPAFEHLRTADGESCDLEVCLWDSKSTGAAMDPPPCAQHKFTNRGNIWGFDSKRYRTAFQWGECSVNAMDTETNRAVYWVNDASQLPFWVNASPLRSILHWRLVKDGKQLIHAAVVGTDEGAIVIPGHGGAGKSTTALLCLREGLRYLSDDYAVVQLDPEPKAHSLYCTAKLEVDSLDRFAELMPYGEVKRTGDCEKAVLFLHPAFKDQIVASLPLRALVLPRITGREQTGISPVDALTLEQASSFTTISQLPHTGQSTIDFMRRMTTEIPRARLDLGTDLASIPNAVATCARREAEFAALARTGVDPGTAAIADLPLISVIIPVYNGAKFIREAIECVLAQNYPRIELIVVNDASTDETEEVVLSLPYDICYYEFRTNFGPAEARNRGIRESAADFIAFLDADDLWPPGTLEHLVRVALDNEHAHFIKGRAQVLTRHPETGAYIEDGDPADSFAYYLGTALYRRSAFDRVPQFNRAMRFGEDADWYLRAKEMGLEGVLIDDVTLHVRRHGDNMTWDKSPLELNTVRVLKQVLDRRRERGEI